ncbi:alpha-galactosidase [Microbacteriaceae bacterium VKM Ac-2855]|nr:alpha-galactosidase [Microbacteriaceae bacterium VKM Ac-2855]
MAHRLDWGNDALRLGIEWSDDNAPRLAEVAARTVLLRSTHSVPLIEIITTDAGHEPASSRLSHSQLGASLRYISHAASETELRILTRGGGFDAELLLTTDEDTAAVRSSVTVRNSGERRRVLRSVASWGSALFAPVDELRVTRGRSDWLAEGRWRTAPLRDELPALRSDLTGHDPRGAAVATSHGSWSTGTDLPVGIIAAGTGAIAWQIEHNGAWRWEIGEELEGGSLTLSGPMDDEHAWAHELAPGAEFTTVPASIAFAADRDGAVAELTSHRRARRRAHPDNTAMPVVFNDYMNTLNGDPTTERLLPLIDAAAEAGAEIFCIDAGWYDDSVEPGAWWGSVGEWLPSTARFPGGLCEVIERIRSHGMVTGLWLEPEVIGVRSAMADRLPHEAFLQRFGERVEEHERYHLDLRHPAAIAHLDAVVDRLVAEFGVGFFKFDYNINPGVGTDLEAISAGDGLLEHNRAHLAWIDGVLDRHPGLVIENCSSGAMRADFAMLSRLQMQSTSDQQDFRLYPPIAATAPLSMLPEQAASWAYPQPGMTDEEIAFCLVTGLLGRFYLSGYLNRMTAEQRALVSEAVATAKTLRTTIATAQPSWPLGLPGWTDSSVALALNGGDDNGDDETLVSVWNRAGDAPIRLSLPAFAGGGLAVETVFPTTLPAWPYDWDPASGVLTVQPPVGLVSARTVRLTRVTA